MLGNQRPGRAPRPGPTSARGTRGSRSPTGVGLRATVLAVSVFSGLGCASYTTTIRAAQADVVAGQPDSAITLLNRRLATDESEELPPNLRKNRLLLLLERATLLQAVGEYELAARDMGIADQQLEYLDIDSAKRADVGKWLYSDSASRYRSPVYERLMLNTLNMVNYLVLRDFEDAKVEARRFRLLQEFFVGSEGRSTVPGVLALGNYLGGVSFEAGRDLRAAVLYYSSAWNYGFRSDDLRGRLVDLFRVTRIKPEQGSPAEELWIEAELKGAMLTSEYVRTHLRGDVVVIVQSGLVPHKVAERVPIASALAWSAHHGHHHHGLTAQERQHAETLAVQGVLKWVNFPVLRESGSPGVSVRAQQADRGVELGLSADVASAVRISWRSLVGPTMAAAIVRMIARAAAGGVIRAGSAVAAEAEGAEVIGALGWLASLAVEGALAAADTPDTRSWTTLPALVRIGRVKSEIGFQRFSVHLGDRADRQTVLVDDDNVTVVNFSRLR